MSIKASSVRPLALVTGASQGLGELIALELARRGHDLLLAARGAERLEAVRARVHGERPDTEVVCVTADLATDAGVAALLAAAEPHAARIEVLVNNAGFGDTRSFADMPWADAEQMLRLNTFALTRLTHEFARRFRARGRGRILNVASTGAFQPSPFFAEYGATKAFALSLSEAIREELAPHGVSVSVLCPGPTKTPFHARAGTERSPILRISSMEAEPVAKSAVDGLLAGKAVIVPGFVNKFLVFTVRVSPRWMVRKLAAWLMRPRVA